VKGDFLRFEICVGVHTTKFERRKKGKTERCGVPHISENPSVKSREKIGKKDKNRQSRDRGVYMRKTPFDRGRYEMNGKSICGKPHMLLIFLGGEKGWLIDSIATLQNDV